MRYLEDQAYAALLKHNEPVRSAEIIAEIGNEDYSTKLVRHILAASPRFGQIDRKWDLEVRYEDKQRPLERILTEIVGGFGRPMTVSEAANDLSSVYERDESFYETVVARLFADETKYFGMSNGLFGLRDWLIDPTYDDEADIIFYNDLDQTMIDSLTAAAAKIDWASSDIADTAKAFIKAVKSPVSNKMLDLFRWRALGEKYVPEKAFDQMFNSPDFTWVSDGTWANKDMVKNYNALLNKLADRLSEEVAEEAPAAVTESAEVAEEAAPTLSLTISERDLEEVAQIVAAKGEARMPAILESIFEISPRDPIYAVAAEGLSDAMRADSRFTWVGAERWRMADTIPDFVHAVPPALLITELVFETPEGERLDVELENEGLEGGLDAEIHNPLVQDINDQDPIGEGKTSAGDSIKCTLTRHHKKQGTFPLCQIPAGFLPSGTNLIEVTLIDGEKRSNVWANSSTGLIYGMDAWYSEDMPESGALFRLAKTKKPDEFEFVYNKDMEPLVAVPANRLQELEELGEEAKKADLTTFDLMTRIMPYHRKGIPFVTLFTEINLARRTTRRLVASLLSSYYAFYQRPKSTNWHFDEKKVDQGFKKAKRKYIRKG